MFTVEAKIDKCYQLNADPAKLRLFFTKTANYPRYMPDIFDQVEDLGGGLSIWTLKIDVSAGSPLVVRTELQFAESAHQLSFKPTKTTQNHLALDIDIRPGRSSVDLHFILELRLQRKSGYDIHPLAGLLGERTINKIVRNHAEEYLDQFIQDAERKASH